MHEELQSWLIRGFKGGAHCWKCTCAPLCPLTHSLCAGLNQHFRRSSHSGSQQPQRSSWACTSAASLALPTSCRCSRVLSLPCSWTLWRVHVWLAVIPAAAVAEQQQLAPVSPTHAPGTAT